jgi:hypothetical protein
MKKTFNSHKRENGIIYMDIFNIHGKKICECLIDEKSLKRVSGHRWGSTYDGYNRYVNTKINGKMVNLHVFLKGKKEGFVIDHINRNSLDNRTSNLKHVTQKENVLNQDRFDREPTHGIRGVYYDKSNENFFAFSDYVNGKRRRLKTSKIKEVAVGARREYELTKTSH